MLIEEDSSTNEFPSLQEKTKKRVRNGLNFEHYKIATLSLALLSFLLLISAIVIGVYCGKNKLMLDQNVTQLIAELEQLQAKHTSMIKDQHKVQETFDTESNSHTLLLQNIEQQKSINDDLQRHIVSLQAETNQLQANRSSIAGNCGRCLTNWVLLNQSCYFFSALNSLGKRSWPESREDCIGRGADLIVIENLEELALVNDNFPKVGFSHKLWWEEMVGEWIGLTDVQAEGTWLWVNNVTQVDPGFWIPGEPNNHGEGENCAAIFNRGDPRTTWFDAHCHKHIYNWICEAKPI